MIRRRPSSFLSIVCLCLAWSTQIGEVAAQQGAEEVPLLWASTGGGWRAMFADMGYANVFQQAGLLTDNSSRFSGVVRSECL